MLILIWIVVCIIFYLVQKILGDSGHALELFALFTALALFFIDRLSYEIKDNSITIYSGIFTKIEQNIPHSKVTDFVLYRDILDRFWGMGSIKVQTAGASGETGYEGVLSGLLDYESIHKDLRAKLISSQQTNTNNTSNINTESNDNVLLDILNELKDINNKIDKN